MYRSSMRFARVLVVLAFAACAPAAQASTVSASGTTITIVGGDESSNISFPSGTKWTVDDAAGATAGAGCAQESPTRVTCGFPSEFTLESVVADLGPGDDTYILVGSFAQTVNGGPGNDHIDTGAVDDVVHGDAGNDYVAGGPGSDQVFGDDGDDEVRGGNNSDKVDGGAGRDIVAGDGGDANRDGSDNIFVRDGEADQVDCGFGADVVQADDIDVIDSTLCDSVDAQPVEQPVEAKPNLALSVKKSIPIAKATKKPGYGIGLVVGSDGTLTVKLVISAITARKFGLGKKTIVLDSLSSPVKADSYAVGLWASGATAKRLRALRNRRGFTKIPAVITATLVSDAGGRRTQTAKVALTR